MADSGVTTNDGVAVAGIRSIEERRPGGLSLDAAVGLVGGYAGDSVRLIHVADGVSNVTEFGDHRTLQFHQTDNHSHNKNGADQHKFRRQDHPVFV